MNTLEQTLLRGGRPYRIEVSIESILTLLEELPFMTATPVGRVSLCEFFEGADIQVLAQIIRLVELVPELREAFAELRMKYVGIAYPGATSWPTPKPDEVLEAIDIGAERVVGLVITTDLQRLLAIRDADGEPTRLVTCTEFEVLFDQTIEDYINTYASEKAAQLMRVISLCRAQHQEYEVTYVTDQFEGGTRCIKGFSTDQVTKFAEKHGFHVTSISLKESTHD